MDLNVSQRYGGERWKMLVFQLEPQMLSVKRDGARHIADLVPNAMKALYETLRLLM